MCLRFQDQISALGLFLENGGWEPNFKLFHLFCFSNQMCLIMLIEIRRCHEHVLKICGRNNAIYSPNYIIFFLLQLNFISHPLCIQRQSYKQFFPQNSSKCMGYSITACGSKDQCAFSLLLVFLSHCWNQLQDNKVARWMSSCRPFYHTQRKAVQNSRVNCKVLLPQHEINLCCLKPLR